jgi:hypothetical protein
MTAEIVQFIPRPNPKREEEIRMTYSAIYRNDPNYELVGIQNGNPVLKERSTDCGDLGWPWTEDKA